jgi:hypothetical protein
MRADVGRSAWHRLPIYRAGRRTLTMKRLAGVAVCLLFIASFAGSAQNRVNDKDIQIMMNNLKSDSGRFRSAFNDSVKKSTIRRTSREKESKSLVTNQSFKTTKKADTQLALVIDTAGQIDKLLRDVFFDEATNSSWAKVKVEIRQLADAYGVQDPLP